MITSKSAHAASVFALDPPKPEPPADLIEEEARFWREIVADLPHGHIRSDNTPVLRELCRHMVYSRQVAEQLRELRERHLAAHGPTPAKDRSVFNQLVTIARDESRLISNLSVKLRLVNQTRDDSPTAERSRDREPQGPKPWERRAGRIERAERDLQA